MQTLPRLNLAKHFCQAKLELGQTWRWPADRIKKRVLC
jgi:hypothetical protein